jgi:hypothetical protein
MLKHSIEEITRARRGSSVRHTTDALAEADDWRKYGCWSPFGAREPYLRDEISQAQMKRTYNLDYYENPQWLSE